MPALTLSTSPKSNSLPRSWSPSPNAPPMSPLTPTFSSSRPVYTHQSQTAPVPIRPPPPEQIDFSSNPDVLALKATISILQQQKRTAEADMTTLTRIKSKALQNPEAFARALGDGKIRMRGDELLHPTADSDDEEGDEEGEGLTHGHPERVQKEEEWERLPGPQNVVRMPAVEWGQYGVVGESLEKLHEDQVARPMGGTGPGEQRRVSGGVAAVYNPSKDKIEKGGGVKKGGKR